MYNSQHSAAGAPWALWYTWYPSFKISTHRKWLSARAMEGRVAPTEFSPPSIKSFLRNLIRSYGVDGRSPSTKIVVHIKCLKLWYCWLSQRWCARIGSSVLSAQTLQAVILTNVVRSHWVWRSPSNENSGSVSLKCYMIILITFPFS